MLDQDAVLRPLKLDDLDAVMRLEALSYSHPWSRGNFVDSLVAGYWAYGLAAPSGPDAGRLLAYAWAMEGVDEVHLLNVTVCPDHRRRGLAQRLMDALVLWSHARGQAALWLEVRMSNEAARRLYERYGFDEAGLRKRYYPVSGALREDALLMRLDVRAKCSAALEPVR